MKKLPMLALVISPLLLSNCREAKERMAEARKEAATAGDVTFAKTTFESLARGDSAAAERIDWPVLTSLGTNIGADYAALLTDVEKQKFASGFITQFSASFRDSGGSVDAFTNWRVSSHDSTKTEVAADSTSGILTMTVSVRDGVERVSSINIVR